MIKLANGATVLAADLTGITRYSSFPTGTVLARSHNDYVVWSVGLRRDAAGNDHGIWDAYSGDYFNRGDDLVSDDLALSDAMGRYNERRMTRSLRAIANRI